MPRRDLQLAYAVPDARDTWVARMESACRALEAAFAGQALRVATPYRERDAVSLVRDRPGFFEKKLRTRTRWFSLHSGDPNLGERCDRPVRFEGYEPASYDDHVTVGGRVGGGSDGLYGLVAVVPARPWTQLEALFVALGDAALAFSAHLSPRDTEERLWRVQIRAALGYPERASELESRLPLLAYTRYGGLEAPEQPSLLGWLNYWSEVTARWLGFPDPARDGALLAHSYRTPAGAWLVKLGPEPLDCGNAQHVELLVRTYERFPRLGVRAPPRSP